MGAAGVEGAKARGRARKDTRESLRPGPEARAGYPRLEGSTPATSNRERDEQARAPNGGEGSGNAGQRLHSFPLVIFQSK